MAKKKWNQVGGIWKSKNNPKKKYISLRGGKEAEALIARLESNDFVTLFYESPSDKLDRFLENRIIDEAEHEEKVSNLPANLVFEINLPPEDE